MKLKFLAAAASIAFIAAGVASQAQEQPKREEHPAAQRAEPKAGGAVGTHEQSEPKAAQAEPRRDEMKGGAQGENPAARTEGERNETKGAERPRAAEAPGKERKAAQGDNAQRTGVEGKRTAEPNGEKTPAERTGATEQKSNERTGANEQKGAERTGANEQKGAERTGANEQDRNGAKSAERNENHGQARVKGNVKMSSEHATRVIDSLRREGNRENARIDVRVGARVPESIVVRPLPEDVIAIVPEYRGYDYFIDDSDEIVFVAPQTHEVVGMIDYEGRAASDETYTRVGASRPCPTEQ